MADYRVKEAPPISLVSTKGHSSSSYKLQVTSIHGPTLRQLTEGDEMSMRVLRGNQRRVLQGLGFLLLILAAGLNRQAVAAPTSTATMPVTCNVMPTIEGSFPAFLDLGDVDPDTSYVVSTPQTVTVRSNTKWALKIRSDAADGCLKEWTGTGYSSRALSSPLEWKTHDGVEFVGITDSDAPVVAEKPPTGQEGEVVNVLFKQQVNYNDAPLLEPGTSYRIEVTFTAVQTY